jgi:hypothetical protein
MVNIVTKLWFGKSGVHTLEWAEDFSLLQHVQIDFAIHPASYSMETRSSFTSSKPDVV